MLIYMCSFSALPLIDRSIQHEDTLQPTGHTRQEEAHETGSTAVKGSSSTGTKDKGSTGKSTTVHIGD